MTPTNKILIVEDDLHIRRLLRTSLERMKYVVAEAENARDALSLLEIEKPDVVLLDLGLPDRDGLEMIQLIKARSAATLIVVSAREATEAKVTALDLGADDYLTKPFDTEELMARIRTALRHRISKAVESMVVTFSDVQIDLERRVVKKAGAEVHLSPKEYAVLSELARKPDRVISHTSILQTVWGAGGDNRVDYLRIIVRTLRQKLEVDAAAPQFIINEPGVGYRLRTDP
ncbi:MAG: Fis family transcriptional regulator [Sphingomonadales bacterium]|nr:Fis family transcriptional regulator [Sphingomonadales bacterium]